MKAILVLALLFCVVAVSFAKRSEYRSADGSGNNRRNPNWGKSFTLKLRKVNKYEDGFSVPFGGEPSRLPSPRFISNLIFDGRVPALLAPKTTNALTFFGQFIDHDITLTDIQDKATCERFDIPIPQGDVFFDPKNEGRKTMCFCKSIVAPGTGTGPTNPREFLNQDTGYIDLSNVYGNTDGQAAILRTFQDGLLKTSEGPDGELLPFNVDPITKRPLVSMANEGLLPQTELFAAGDPRANEHSILACYHTLFLREHNRRARSLPKEWSDEKKYQVARKWTIAHFQHLIYTEFLPTVLGRRFPRYTGYNDSVESQTDLTFATAFMRMGHDQISSVQDRLQLNGRVIPLGNILLRDTFFKPQAVYSVGIGPYFRGATTTYQQKMDSQLVDDVRNFVYSQGPVTTDLAARNIQRAREFGLGSFNDAREALGLTRYTKYSDITQEPQAIAALEKAYGPDGIDQVDIFVGALLETKLPNSLFGETLAAAFIDQFERYRSGDRFFYLNRQFTREQLKEIKETTLGDIIARNTDSVNIPKYPFLKDQRTSSQILDPNFHQEGEQKYQEEGEHESYERFARDVPEQKL